MKSQLTILASLVGTTIASHGALTLINDDFSSDTSAASDTRYTAGDIDSGNWIKRDASWSASTGSLVNAANTATDERGAHLINSVSSVDTSLTQITVSFDYVVGAGTTLYFSSSLHTGALSDGNINARLTRADGTWYADDFNNDSSSFGGFLGPDYNLKDGSTPAGNTAGALTSFTNSSGTFSQTYDISAFGGSSFSIADVSHVLAVFTSDNDTTGGAISIDNFNMTAVAVPEPSSTALLGLGGLALILRRRK